MNTISCSICLNKNDLAFSVDDRDNNNITWFTKLKYFNPDQEWFPNFLICELCIKKIKDALSFRELLLKVKPTFKDETVVDVMDQTCCDLIEEDINCDEAITKKGVSEDTLFSHITSPLKAKNVALKVHLKQCENENKGNDVVFKCDSCNNSYSTKKNLKLHKPWCKKDDNILDKKNRKVKNQFSCEICAAKFAFLKLIIEHCVSQHSMDKKAIKPYSCDDCALRFSSSANLIQHRKYHSRNRSHMCSLCGKGFITISDLTVHEYTHFNRRNYKCEQCEKAFNTNKNLRTHALVVHTDRNLWKYSCDVCQKRFPLKTNFDQHMRRHNGEKNHVCHICKKAFVSKSEMLRHVGFHSNIKAFKCSECDKEYKDRRTYNVHIAKVHAVGEGKISIREKKFVCHICPSQFYDKQKLSRHLFSHSGLRPFACSKCDKRFSDKSYLKHHLKSVHNVVEINRIGV